MIREHAWCFAIMAALGLTLLFVALPLLADLRPFGSERRWSKKWRAQRADISRLQKRGTP